MHQCIYMQTHAECGISIGKCIRHYLRHIPMHAKKWFIGRHTYTESSSLQVNGVPSQRISSQSTSDWQPKLQRLSNAAVITATVVLHTRSEWLLLTTGSIEKICRITSLYLDCIRRATHSSCTCDNTVYAARRYTEASTISESNLPLVDERVYRKPEAQEMTVTPTVA